ncbi:MAG: ammonium transporter [Gammaproteobacteria bacterium]|nr:ammonium transporter [Gammaproteobacteria bacterium]
MGISGDTLWIVCCGLLVVLMQAGFTCLESGMVRSKNSINVAIKNLVDFCISILLFALFGFGLMFGASQAGLIGWDDFLLQGSTDADQLAFFFFQAVFCGTATTIVSGAVAERMRFVGYIATAVILSGLIYPVIGHWSWSSDSAGDPAGWLGKLGFVDFAGSSVVHSVGGWVALAAMVIIGPRLGRFGQGSHAIEGHSLPLAVLGVFLLWFGWFGFNAGSTLELSDKIPMIIVNTALAGAAGGLMAMFFSWLKDGRPLIDRVMNGVIAGLVGITAGCHLVSPWSAVLIGSISGVLVVLSVPLLERFRIDDAIHAVPAHLFAGIWGTLAVALFAPLGSWLEGLSRWEFFQVQLLGVVSIGLYAFGLSFLLLLAMDRWVFRLRVSASDERIGLNIAEHGASSALLQLITQMDRQARSGDFSRPVEVEAETEAAQIASFYNTVLEKVSLEGDRKQMAMKKLAELANHDTLTGLANRRHFFDALKHVLARCSRTEVGGAVLYMDLDGFKQVNDRLGHQAGDDVLREAARRIQSSVREIDLVGRMGGDEFALLMEDADDPEEAAIRVAEKIIERVSEPWTVDGEPVQIGVSIGIAPFSCTHLPGVKRLIQQADNAMYAAKLAGKGVYRFYAENHQVD